MKQAVVGKKVVQSVMIEQNKMVVMEIAKQ